MTFSESGISFYQLVILLDHRFNHSISVFVVRSLIKHVSYFFIFNTTIKTKLYCDNIFILP